jgi:hypothetical protein
VVIQNDLREMLEKDGMFSPYIAFGRVGVEIHILLHTGNPSYPKHETVSKTGEPVPLKGVGKESGVVDKTRRREIDSPNLTRIANSLPIPVSTVPGKGEQKELRYEKGGFPEPPPPQDVDKSAETAKEWGQL